VDLVGCHITQEQILLAFKYEPLSRSAVTQQMWFNKRGEFVKTIDLFALSIQDSVRILRNEEKLYLCSVGKGNMILNEVAFKEDSVTLGQTEEIKMGGHLQKEVTCMKHNLVAIDCNFMGIPSTWIYNLKTNQMTEVAYRECTDVISVSEDLIMTLDGEGVTLKSLSNYTADKHFPANYYVRTAMKDGILAISAISMHSCSLSFYDLHTKSYISKISLPKDTIIEQMQLSNHVLFALIHKDMEEMVGSRHPLPVANHLLMCDLREVSKIYVTSKFLSLNSRPDDDSMHLHISQNGQPIISYSKSYEYFLHRIEYKIQ